MVLLTQNKKKLLVDGNAVRGGENTSTLADGGNLGASFRLYLESNCKSLARLVDAQLQGHQQGRGWRWCRCHRRHRRCRLDAAKNSRKAAKFA
jgi:hypothetical protein